MDCSSCQRANPAGSRFCNGCGAPLEAACAACGQVNPPDAAFCNACGRPLGGAAHTASDPRAYTPRHLAERILRTRAALEGERKHVTVLFCDVVDSTPLAARLGPEETHALMDRFIRLVCGQVHAFEGTVNQFLGDGTMALFGAPLALEGAPRRALCAALGIRREVARLSAEVRERFGLELRTRIGIHSGPVVVGRVGDDLRMDYTAVGDTTHLAARLQGAALPNGIVVSEATRQLVSGWFELRDLGSVELKGIPKPVRAFEVLSERPVRDRVEARLESGLTPLVGRERELAALQAAFEAVREGRGQVAFVVGEAGLGKSRLLFEFRRRLGTLPRVWIEGRCASYARNTAFHPIADALRQAFGISDRDDEPSALATLEEAERSEGGSLAWTLPFVRLLLSLSCGDAAVEQLDPATRRSETFRALRARLERAASGGPFVLVVEDLHWVDKASEEFLGYLSDAIAGLPALLLLTHRPGYRHPFGDRSYHLRVALQPLSEPEMGSMAGAVLDAGGLPAELGALIARKAEGNPFFVEEVTKSLLEDGVLRRVDGRVELARPVDGASVPDSIQDVLMARLDRLGEEPKRALQIASVIGREFAVRLLERIHEAGARLHPLLAELRALELIHEKAVAPEIAFMFKHALTHDVAYASVLGQRRKALHRIVGSAIEELYPDRLAEHYEALAHHFTEGEDLEKGLHYHGRASEKAAEAFANAVAAEHCRRALALVERLGARAPAAVRHALEARLGHVSHLMSEFAASGEAYLRAAAAAETPRDRSVDRARAAYAFGWAHDYERARSAIDGALADRGEGVGAGEAMALAARGFFHGIAGDLGRFEELLERGARLAGDDEEVLALTCLLEGELAEWRGDYRRALASQARAIELSRKHGRPEYLVPAVWFSGKALCCLGEYGRALETLEEGLAFSERLGYAAAQTRVLNTIGWLYGEAGSHRRAAEYNQRSVTAARGMVELALVPGAPELYGNASINLARNHIALGDVAAAADILAEIRAQVDAERDPWMLWRYRLHLVDAEARLRLARGDADAALVAAEQQLAGARTHGARKLEARALELLARAQLALDRRVEAEAALRDAGALAEAIGYPPALWRTAALEAELARRMGDRGRADRAAARVRSSTDALARGLPRDELARTLRALGAQLADEPFAGVA